MIAFVYARWRRCTALVISLAVLHCAPGLAVYSVLAANLKAAPKSGVAIIAPLHAASLERHFNLNVIRSPASRMPAAMTNASLNIVSPAPVAAHENAANLLPALAPAEEVNAALAERTRALAALEAEGRRLAASRSDEGTRIIAQAQGRRLFEGSTRRDELSAVFAAGRAAAVISLAAPTQDPASEKAPAPNASRQPAPPAGPSDPAGPNRGRVSIGLLLAIGGGVGAWYAAPVFLPALLALSAHLPFSIPALPLLAYKAIITTLGVGAGFAAFSTRTWKNFPADLRDDAIGAARTTFRFWARFGLIFDSVLRGKSSDEAMKGEVPAGLLKYPLIAWPFVALGYVFTPVAFALGAAWRVIGTPILAAVRGAREVAVGFFPWLARVFRFLSRVIRNIIPFAGGYLWGTLRGLFMAGVVGAVVLAAPVFRDAVAAKYAPQTLPGWVGYRLLQLGGLSATLVLGLVGVAAGLVVSPLHVLLSAFERAFAWSGAHKGAEAFFGRWLRALSADRAFTFLLERGSASAGAETLAARGSRLINGTLISLALSAALPAVSLASLIRSLSSAFDGKPVNDDSPDWYKSVPAKGAERPVESTPGFAFPVILAVFGAGTAVLAASAFSAGLGLYAAAALAGAGLGLALSQPKALLALPNAVAADASRAGTLAWTSWSDAGRRTVAAVLGAAKMPALGLLLSAVPGAVMTVASFAAGGLYGVAAGLTKASWKGLLEMISRFLPALRRFLNFLTRVLKNAVPFALGFLWGAFAGFFKTSFVTAVAFFKPVIEAFEAEGRERKRPSEAQIGLGLLLGLTLLPLAAAVFAGGFAIGAVLGLPVTLTLGLSRAVMWSNPSERSVAYFRAWERQTLPRAAQDALNVVTGVFSGRGTEMPVWRLYVRLASSLAGAPVTAFVIVAAAAKAYIRSLLDAFIVAEGGRLPPSPKEPTTPYTPIPEMTPPAPAAQAPAALAAVAGLVGLSAGAAAAWTLWAGYTGLLAALPILGLPLLGLATGLAVSQPAFWRDILPLAFTHGKSGLERSYEYWKNSGDAALQGLFGVPRGSLYALPHRLVGGVLGLGWTLAGAVYGAGAAFLTGAYEGARQVVYEILPFLRTAFETVMKILRRVVPFVFGLIAGAVAGIVGSAAFGALLLGRPYFKHVVGENFAHRGAIAFLGNLFLKLVAGVLGVLFGLAGVAIGIVVAAPYALTTAVALAFRFAEIGGPVQRYFDRWSYGALREEMRRINQLTSRFRFEDAPEGGAPSLAAGWIRMANILPATVAAVFAAGVAGLVSYVRSLISAYRSSASGQPVPAPVVDEESSREWDRTWSRAGRTARQFFGWAVAGAAVGAGVWAFTAWAPLGLAGWLLVGAAAGLGAILAFSVAGFIAMAALILWISGQLR